MVVIVNFRSIQIPFASSIIPKIEIALLTLFTFPQKSLDKIYY